jgi:hypothetical protein
VTSGGGLILIRELDEQLGLEKLIAEQLIDSQSWRACLTSRPPVFTNAADVSSVSS